MTFTDIDLDFRVPDDVWERVSCVIPQQRPKTRGRRPQMSDRAALDAVLALLNLGMN